MNARKFFLLLFLSVVIILPFVLLNMEFANLFRQGLLVILSAVTGLWIVSLLIKDASIVDIFWGLGFVIMAWFYAMQMGELSTRQWIIVSLVSIWGLRLCLYLGWRNIGKDEDYRYVQMRKAGGKYWWLISWLRVFIMQGVILWIISSVFVPGLLASKFWTVTDYLGIALWGIGFFFEAVGDWQLARFKKRRSSSEEVLDSGLWRYTRHPNYFGDATLWWGYFCFALSYAGGWMYVFSPIFMTFLLLKISGAALLEKDLKKNKPKYAEYIRKTSVFFPLPPR